MFTSLETDIIDTQVYKNTLVNFRKKQIKLPTFAELSNPLKISQKFGDKLLKVDPQSPDPLNLYRVHWHNSSNQREILNTPLHVVLPKDLTGVDSQIIVLFGNRFPIINAHKVLAAYACLIPKLLTGKFDISRDKAVWPSTGNYCRGGVAISKILGCRGVAVLPEGMSKERFVWLEKWITNKADIIRTPGSESNVKEGAKTTLMPESVLTNSAIPRANTTASLIPRFIFQFPTIRGFFIGASVLLTQIFKIFN